MTFESDLKTAVACMGAEFIFTADISKLPAELTRNFQSALVVGVRLSKGYLKMVAGIPDYIENMKRNHLEKEDEFDQKEKFIDSITDKTADYIISKGYSAFSQSEANLHRAGLYDEKNHRTPLPHKTIALQAGMGWIGKHDLLVTPDWGSAVVISTVLTDAPLNIAPLPILKPKCGDCTLCRDVCPTKAISGKNWSVNTQREEIVDVYKCSLCLRCLALCPWTQTYTNKPC